MSAALQVDPWESLLAPLGQKRYPASGADALSKETADLLSSARSLRPKQPPSSLQPSSESQAEEVFGALASAKVATSQVAMHLLGEWRRELFRQLDALHNVAEWEEGDRPLDGSSYATFLKTFLALHITRRPGLGLSAEGNLIGAWTSGRDRLTLEFLPGNQVRWVVSREVMGKPERAAGVSWIKRLAEVLAPYQPDTWFSA